MTDDVRSFGATAKSLSRNPLGIIALFIVLVYGIAALVTALGSSLTADERLPLIWFLVIFPPVVLGVFAWLVSRHPGKLYGPQDYKNEENYTRILLEQLEARVELVTPTVASRRASRTTWAASVTAGSLQTPHEDSLLAIAQMRLSVERELFLLCRALPVGSRSPSLRDAAQPVNEYLRQLEIVEALDSRLAGNLRDFVSLANSIMHGKSAPEDDARRAAVIGSALVAALRHRRLVAELELDFQSHGLWHIGTREAAPDSEARKYHFWSAVAATLPEFDYDYDVYREAALHHNEDAGHQVYVLSLGEFVRVLAFREHELKRIIGLWGPQGWDIPASVDHERIDASANKAVHWHWPSEWGEIGWTGPVLRERVHLNGAEEELMRTRVAREHYEAQLKSERRH